APARAEAARSRSDDLRDHQRDRAQDRGRATEPDGCRLRFRLAQTPRRRAPRLVPLPRRFYLRPARAVAPDLLGCIVVSRRGRSLTAGPLLPPPAPLGPPGA